MPTHQSDPEKSSPRKLTDTSRVGKYGCDILSLNTVLYIKVNDLAVNYNLFHFIFFFYSIV